MTTNIESGSSMALFIHQMIPHHQNAVNMAKALLKTEILQCDNLAEETDDCVLESILLEIVNSQNFQIQTMRGILDEKGYPETDDCEVLIEESSANETASPTSSARGVSIGMAIAACGVALASLSLL